MKAHGELSAQCTFYSAHARTCWRTAARTVGQQPRASEAFNNSTWLRSCKAAHEACETAHEAGRLSELPKLCVEALGERRALRALDAVRLRHRLCGCSVTSGGGVCAFQAAAFQEVR